MRIFNLRNDRRFQNLFAIIATLEAKGLVCGVHEDGAGAFFVRGKRGLITDSERAGIDVCREGLREAWLLMQDRCTRCGLDPAVRPNVEGRIIIGAVFNPELNKGKGGMQYQYAKCTSLLTYPFFCNDCCDNPQTWRELAGEPKHALSAESITNQSPPLPDRAAASETR